MDVISKKSVLGYYKKDEVKKIRRSICLKRNERWIKNAYSGSIKQN